MKIQTQIKPIDAVRLANIGFNVETRGRIIFDRSTHFCDLVEDSGREEDWNNHFTIGYCVSKRDACTVSLPTYDQVFEWFYEVHGLHCYWSVITKDHNGKWIDWVYYINNVAQCDARDEQYKTMRSVRDAALNMLISIVESKRDKDAYSR